MNKSEEKRTTINISIRPDDKKFLKMYALERDTTVAALIEDFVTKLREDGENK